jgi:hypothetical protein
MNMGLRKEDYSHSFWSPEVSIPLDLLDNFQAVSGVD